MQVNFKCADCGESIGGFFLKGIKQTVEIHACYHKAKCHLRARIVESLEWMTKDMVWRHNQTKMNVDEGSEGGYSLKLQTALDLLDEIRDGDPTIEDGN